MPNLQHLRKSAKASRVHVEWYHREIAMNDLHPNTMEWLQPWVPTPNPLVGTNLATELRKEVGKGHVLFGRPATALAHRIDQDDVLFVVENPIQFAVVHLTYAAKPDRPPWPVTTLFEDIESFVENQMKPDHEEYIGSG